MSLETPAGRATVVMLCALFGLSRQAYYVAKRALLSEGAASASLPAYQRPEALRASAAAIAPLETRAAALETGAAIAQPEVSEVIAQPEASGAGVARGEVASAATSGAVVALPQTNGGSRRKGVSAEVARAAIEAIVATQPAWGVRKVWATMRRKPYGLKVGKRRVWALMKAMGLCLPPDRSHRVPVTSGHIVVSEPNRRWATDLTTVWTKQDGLVAVVPVVDCGCRSALAVTVTKRQDAPAVLGPVRAAMAAAFERASEVPAELELRTDHGPQYTAEDCDVLCREWNLDHTFAPVGRPTGNAVAERLIRTMKEECIWLRDWTSAAELQAALDEWRTTYNEARPHQALGWQTPSERRAQKLGERRLAA